MYYARHEGGEISELCAHSRESAISELAQDYREWGGETTAWYDVAIAEAAEQPASDSDDWETITVTVAATWLHGKRHDNMFDPTEPDCEDGKHNWEAPHAIVGGIKENPGVWGNGGGVTIREVCLKCGHGRLIDTWAQRPDTGEQGLRSVSYYPHYVQAVQD